jgi:hypothetical protein
MISPVGRHAARVCGVILKKENGEKLKKEGYGMNMTQAIKRLLFG